MYPINFCLPACITIDNAESLIGDINQLGLKTETILTLDASATEIITTPGAQLLVSIHKTLSESLGKLLISNATDSFADAMRMLGLQAQLGVWSEPHA